MAVPHTGHAVYEVMQAPDVAMGMSTSAGIAGIPEVEAQPIVRVGLPLLARSAQRHPDIFSSWYASTVLIQSIDIADYYRQLVDQPERQVRLRQEFESTFGEFAALAVEAGAGEAGSTIDAASAVLSMAMPGVNHAIARTTEGMGEAGMMAWLKAVSAT